MLCPNVKLSGWGMPFVVDLVSLVASWKFGWSGRLKELSWHNSGRMAEAESLRVLVIEWRGEMCRIPLILAKRERERKKESSIEFLDSATAATLPLSFSLSVHRTYTQSSLWSPSSFSSYSGGPLLDAIFCWMSKLAHILDLIASLYYS